MYIAFLQNYDEFPSHSWQALIEEQFAKYFYISEYWRGVFAIQTISMKWKVFNGNTFEA